MAETKRRTGTAEFDSLMSGGFPDRSAILVEGPPGAGKSTLCREFAFTGLINGEKCLYITTGMTPAGIVKSMKEFDWDVEQHKGNLLFIDCYSWRLPPTQREQAKYQLSTPTSLNELNIFVEAAAKELGMGKDGGRIILDSVSDLLMHADAQTVFKFIQIFVSLAREVGATALIAVEKDLHAASDVATLNYLTDGTVEMRLEGETRSIRITRMQGTVHELRWVNFRIIKGVGLRVMEFFA